MCETTSYLPLYTAIAGAGVAFMSQYMGFMLSSIKDKKIKTNELYGSLIQCTEVIKKIRMYTLFATLMYAFHHRRLQIAQREYKTINADTEAENAKFDIKMYMDELNKFRMILVTEESNLKKFFNQLNSLHEMLDIEEDLNKILEYQHTNDISFNSTMTSQELAKIDPYELQVQINKELKKEFNPLLDTFIRKIKSKIYKIYVYS